MRDWDYSNTGTTYASPAAALGTRPAVGRTAGRATTVVSALAAFSLVGGAALAVWTTSGTGTGAAKATSFTAPTVTAGTASAQLYPGGTGDLVVQAGNPNPFAITVTLAAAGTVTASGGAGTCTTTGVAFTGGSFTLPASSGTVTRTLIGKVTMDGTSDTGCQGATFSVPVTTSSVSS